MDQAAIAPPCEAHDQPSALVHRERPAPESRRAARRQVSERRRKNLRPQDRHCLSLPPCAPGLAHNVLHPGQRQTVRVSMRQSTIAAAG